MPQVTVDGHGSFQVPSGKRLINALSDECGQDILHACGGQARCVTCRVQFLAGEPREQRPAEKQVLSDKGFGDQPGVRLSCQILCDQDMTLRVLARFEGSGRKDAGARPKDQIEP